MVESRWLRWIGPGVVALGAVGFIASTTLGAGVRPWVPNACAGSAAGSGRCRARPPACEPSPNCAERPGIGWIRSSIAMGRSAVSAWPSGSMASGPPARSISRARRSRPARSGRSSSSDPMTARHPASRPSTSRAVALGRSPMSATSSAAPRSTRPAVHLRDARRSRHPCRPRHLATPHRRQRGRTPGPRCASARRPVRPHLLDRLHLGCRGRPARRPVLRRARVPHPCHRAGRRSDRDARRPGPRADPRARWRPCSDLRGLSGTPLPDRRDRPVDRRSPGPRAGGRVGRRHPDRRRCATRPRGRLGERADGCGPSRPTAREPSIWVSIPDDLRLHPSSVRADAATSLPAGWVLLAQDGRLPADPTDDRPQLRHVPDGSTVPLDEALR